MPLNPKALSGGIAVITGGAAGLGYAMAVEARHYGMHVVIVDIREESLRRAVPQLLAAPAPREMDCRVVGAVCDVTEKVAFKSVAASIANLQRDLRAAAPKLYPKDPPVQFVAANAGVIFPKSTVLSGTPSEWDTTYRVNVLGVVNTLQALVPAMLGHPEPGLVVVTGSVAGVMPGGYDAPTIRFADLPLSVTGLTSPSGLRWATVGPYGTSKLAAVGVAEALYRELDEAPGAPLRRISVVALCPGIVRTELLTSSGEASPTTQQTTAAEPTSLEAAFGHGMSPEVPAREVFRHAVAGKFYCIVENDLKRDGMEMAVKERVSERYTGMMTGYIDRHLKAKL